MLPEAKKEQIKFLTALNKTTREIERSFKENGGFDVEKFKKDYPSKVVNKSTSGRVLTIEEIDDMIEETLKVFDHKHLRFVLRQKLIASLKSFHVIKVDINLIPDAIRALKTQIITSLFSAGDDVGTIAASSLTSSLTQTMLDAFKVSGDLMATHEQRVDRAITSAKSQKEFAVFVGSNCTSPQEVKEVMDDFIRKNANLFIVSKEVRLVKNEWWYLFYEDYDTIQECIDEEDSFLSNVIVTLDINKQQLYNTNTTLEEVGEKLVKNYLKINDELDLKVYYSDICSAQIHIFFGRRSIEMLAGQKYNINIDSYTYEEKTRSVISYIQQFVLEYLVLFKVKGKKIYRTVEYKTKDLVLNECMQVVSDNPSKFALKKGEKLFKIFFHEDQKRVYSLLVYLKIRCIKINELYALVAYTSDPLVYIKEKMKEAKEKEELFTSERVEEAKEAIKGGKNLMYLPRSYSFKKFDPLLLLATKRYFIFSISTVKNVDGKQKQEDCSKFDLQKHFWDSRFSIDKMFYTQGIRHDTVICGKMAAKAIFLSFISDSMGGIDSEHIGAAINFMVNTGEGEEIKTCVSQSIETISNGNLGIIHQSTSTRLNQALIGEETHQSFALQKLVGGHRADSSTSKIILHNPDVKKQEVSSDLLQFFNENTYNDQQDKISTSIKEVKTNIKNNRSFFNKLKALKDIK